LVVAVGHTENGTLLLKSICSDANTESRNRLTVEVMSEKAVTSSEIEGEILDRQSVPSSIRRQLGLSTDVRRAAPTEQGIAEMMVDLYQRSNEPLDEATLCGSSCPAAR